MIELLLAGIIATIATGALFGAPEPVRPSLYERFAGARMLAWVFAGASVLVNAAYYYTPGIGWGDGLRAALICLALPACIAFYSHSVAEKAIRAKQLKSEGLTDVQIAAELGVHRNSVPKLLDGHKEPAQ